MEYVVIVGGGVANKGAQSMTFQLVKEIRKHMPEKEIVVFANSKRNNISEMNVKYNFKSVALDPKDILYFSGGFKKAAAVILGEKKKNIGELEEILNHTCLAFDISGYSFSSEWPAMNSVKYLYRIQMMKKKKIPMIIMPQSFGPFNYSAFWKKYIEKLAGKLLKYPAAIYAREEESYQELDKKYILDNLYKSVDMVLLGGEINRSEIYCGKSSVKNLVVVENSVGVIPNKKVLEHGKETEVLGLYQRLLDCLLELGKEIYIVQHSIPDQAFCQQIKELYSQEEKVHLIREELDCLDYDELVSKFDYVVASRYHSIVHAYKQNIPCIAIGWSYKYQVLLNNFAQSKYLIDKKNIQEVCIENHVNEMEREFTKEKEIIKNEIDKLKKENFYDEIFNRLV